MTEEHSFDPFAGGELLRVSPTTAPQQEIFAAAKISDEANTAFNEAISLRIDGPLDKDLLEKCFNILIERHEILRSTFSPAGDELCLHEPQNVTFEFEDIRHYDKQQKQRLIQNLERNIAISPMNLEEGPLFFVWLKQLENTIYELIIATHHLICDGWSFGIMLKEITELYNNDGSDHTLKQPESYYDFAEQQAAAFVKNIDTDFWRDVFKQLPPTLDLPLDRPRPLTRNFRAARFDYRLKKELVTKIPNAASKLKSSLVNFVLAGHFTLLYRLTGNQDIVVGLPLAGQAAFNHLDMFGHMVQLIPIRIHLAGDDLFGDVVQSVKKEVLNASEHPNFTFGQLLENQTVDRSRVPLINTIFNIDQAAPPIKLGTASANVRSIPRAADSFEIFLNIVPSINELLIEATYSTALFRRETIAAWMEALETLLQEAVENPEQRLDNLKLCDSLPDVVEKFNQTERDYKHDDFVSAFNSQKNLTPDSIAVISDNRKLTYSQLDNSSSKLAEYLYGIGVTEGSVVGICCVRSEKLLVSTLAILKLGAAYLPLDPDYPQDRLVYMLEDSGAIAVIQDEKAPQGVKDTNIHHVDINTFEEIAKSSVPFPKLSPDGNRLAYMIYTSGSTGKPKGVKVQCQAMINFLESMERVPGFSSNDRMLAFTTLSFDISVLEMFLPIIVGGSIVIANSDDYKDGEQLAKLIEQHNITVLQATPGTWRMLLASSWVDSKATKGKKLKAISGGEPLPQSLINDLLPRVAELWNGYGPTEATVYASFKRINNTDPLITIGTPVDNTSLFILDSNLNPLPISTPGELCIGGDGVTLGYHKRPDLNEKVFVDHPQFGRIYRTGDVAKVLSIGEVQHLGRIDNQVKLRGYRIELGEIESALLTCDGVKQAAVFLWEISEIDVRIVACCRPDASGAIDSISIRRQLRAQLPNYMVPQYFLTVDDIPLGPSGKVDRTALPRPEISDQSILSKSKLTNDTEKLIAGIWSDLIKVTGAIGRDDNFFEIGGHSLLALEVVRRIEIATGVRLEISQIITERLGNLAEKIADSEKISANIQDSPTALKQSAIRHLSTEQSRLLRYQLSHPKDTSNNLPASWLLEGELDIESFKASMKRLYDRQTALRTIISEGEDGHHLLLQHITETEILILKDFSEKANPLEEAIKNATEIAKQPFIVINNQLCHIWLYKLTPTKHLISLLAHQLVFDGWSFDIFLKELEIFYSNILMGNAASLDPLPVQFRDFTEWASFRQPNRNILEYHRKSLQRSVDRTYPFNVGAPKGKCEREIVKLNYENLQDIESFCEKHQVRLHEVIFSALAKYYGEYLKEDEITITLPVTGRYIPESIGLIGCFVSKLPAAVTISSGNFLETTIDISAQLRVFHENQDLNLGQLLQGTVFEDQALPTGLSLSFAYQDIRNRPNNLADLKLTQISIDRDQSELPVEFWARVETDGLLLVIDYDNAQTEKAIVTFLLEHIAALLKNIKQFKQNNEMNEATNTMEIEKKPLWRRLFK